MDPNIMKHLRLALLSLLLLLCFGNPNQAYAAGETDLGRGTWHWNTRNVNEPLLALPQLVRGNSLPLLSYADADFAFELAQPLSYDPQCDCFALIVATPAKRANQALQLWHAPAGFYRTANGPYLELQDLGALKQMTALSGTRYLFAPAGAGEWRCVSIHETAGSYILIDYDTAGLITRLRDAHDREVVPTYRDQQLISITQMWTVRNVPRVRITIVQPEN
jgi:hypothetical protein